MKKQYENPMIEVQVVDDIDILTCSMDVNGYCPEKDNILGDIWDKEEN